MNGPEKIPGFGEAIRCLREEKGMSQYELAAACECDNTTISKYEREVVPPTMEMLKKIADALDYSPESLLYLGLVKRVPTIKDTDLGKSVKELGQLVNRKRQEETD
jgi:transcriptional regulator with XRE-family HTH domain